MIRVRRLFDAVSELDRQRLAEVQDIFRRAFPYDPAYADKIATLIAARTTLAFEPVLLLAEGSRGQVLGFAFMLFFPDLRAGYLDYIASDPKRPARGIGDALYEAARELLRGKEARCLVLDVPPDEPEKLEEPERLPVNRRRLRFYERYRALPVIGTDYDVLPTAANKGYLTFLVYDPLGHRAPPRRAELRRIVERIFAAKHGLGADDPDVRQIVQSFRDDPVRLREPRYLPLEEAPLPRAWLKPIKVVVAERHEIHHLRERGYVERPVRMRAVLRGLDGLPVEQIAPRRFGEAPIRAVHDPALVSYLERCCARLGPTTLVYPNVFPIRNPKRPPRELEMRAGYFCIDTFTPLTANAYRAARAAADCALTAAELVLNGERLAYALLRPPGHHAERRVFGGFCYFNNAAIAAHRLSARGKVALIDIDHHHGNGSQDIFYRRNDVLFVSIHGHPNYAYPYFSGFADERGEAEGLGFNHNYPLRPGTTDDAYLAALDDALAQIRRFRPDWLVISLGFDIMRGDPTGQFLITLRGMRQIGERLGQLRLPTLVVQEGGYSVYNLRRGARAFFLGLARGWY